MRGIAVWRFPFFVSKIANEVRENADEISENSKLVSEN